MKKILFFVHVPKTAGTSFRKSLEKVDQVTMFYHYSKHNPETSLALMKSVDKDGEIKDKSIFDPDKINVICGHVRFRKYAKCVEPQNVLSILRNPIERLVSEYQHFVRHANMATTFSEFVTSPAQINKQFKMLQGADISGGGLFGLTSHYDCFLGLVKKRFDISLEPRTLNKAPESDHQERFNTPIDEINTAFELNKKDLALFFNVAKVFRKSVQESGIATVPKKDAKFKCRIEAGRRIVGWVSRREQECFFVELSVNGRPRAIVALDQQRRDVVKQGLSEIAQCGFSYSLILLGARVGDEVGMRVLGAPRCSKTLVVTADSEAHDG